MTRPLSIPESIINDCKSAIDRGDVDEAVKQVSLLSGWVNDPLGDMIIHIERWRAENDVTAKSSVFENTAVAVLDWIRRQQEYDDVLGQLLTNGKASGVRDGVAWEISFEKPHGEA